MNHGDIYQTNKSFFDYLIAQNKFFDKGIVFIGSARQSKTLDDYNAKQKFKYSLTHDHPEPKAYSCFPYGEKIAEILHSEFDPLLLADIFGNLPCGESIKRALQPAAKSHSDVPSYICEDKRSILFAQIQKTALAHPKDDIEYQFYDDRKEILDALYDFFSENSELIPQNVKLVLTRYETKPPRHLYAYPSITGEGKPENNYYAKVQTNFPNLWFEVLENAKNRGIKKIRLETPLPKFSTLFARMKKDFERTKEKSVELQTSVSVSDFSNGLKINNID